MLAQVISYGWSVSVCLSHNSIESKLLHRSSWFLSYGLLH